MEQSPDTAGRLGRKAGLAGSPGRVEASEKPEGQARSERARQESQAPRGMSRMVPGDKEEKAAEVSLVNQGRYFSILNSALPWLAVQP